ncbi:MAG: signal peptidase II [Pelovirga sp.]
MKKYPLFVTVVALCLVFDQLSKLYIVKAFALGQVKVLISNHAYITHVRNPGAAFGLFADSAWRLPFFLSVALVALVAILWYLRSLPAAATWMHLALGLVFGGAIGNVIDRIRFGEVIDFIGVHWYVYHWPSFNVADSAICVGVGIMLVCAWHEERQRLRDKKQQKNCAGQL